MAEKKKEGELAEVERSLSVLAGRDPEALRAQREQQEAAQRRRAELDAVSGVERKRITRMALVWAAVAVALLALGGVLLLLRMRASSAEETLAKVIAPFAEMGFARTEPGFFSTQMHAEIDVVEDSCVIAVPTPDTPAIHFDAPGAPFVGKGTLLHCTCAAEHVGVWAERAGSGTSAVALMRVDAKQIGGRLGAAFLEPKPQTIGKGGETCAAEHLEGYVREGRFPKTPPSDDWKKGALGPLAKTGFAAIARVPPDRPLAVLEPANDRCFVALTTEGKVTLRYEGAQPLEGARIAWCGAKLGVAMLERASGNAPIDVVSAPARRIGGLLGLERALATASIVDAPIWAPKNDHAALAAETLHACLVPDATLVADGPIQASATKLARVVSLSVGVPAVADPRGDRNYEPDVGGDVFFVCSPPLAAGVRNTLCVQNGPQTWHPPGTDTPSGAAYGSLPAWMNAWSKVPRDPDLTRIELDLLELGIRLSSLGYEATIIEGVTEDETGVTILGRSGEDGIVAIGIWPAPPWFEPYGDPAWTIDGEPTVTPLAGGTKLRLTQKGKTTAPVKERRTVVFRHAAR